MKLSLTLPERLSPSESALVVVDMQNDFCAPGSHTPALHEATLNNIRFLSGDLCSSADVRKAWS